MPDEASVVGATRVMLGPDDIAVVRQFAATIGVKLPNEAERPMLLHANTMLEWNSRVSLTAIRHPTEIAVKHIADSLACLLAADSATWSRSTVIDVGSGTGYPGVPVATVANPERTTLLEATARKTVFLEDVVQRCGLSGVGVVAGRAEDVARTPQHRGAYDVALARAVAELAVLVELCLPLLRVGGMLVALKSERVEEELRLARGALGTLGGEIANLIEYQLPGIAEGRTAVVVRKVADTPVRYPRRAGMPEKRPLR